MKMNIMWRFKIIHDMVYKRNNIYLLYTQLHLIFLYFAEIKNLVHQAKHTVGITFYYMQLLTYIIRQSLVFLLILFSGVYILFTIYRLKHEVSVEQQVSDIKLRFFTNISHELRTPLTLIAGPVEYVLKSKNINCHSPSRFPKRRLNGDSQTALILYPNPITIGRFNLKYIIRR